MAAGSARNAETEQMCNIPLCGKNADWGVEMFGKLEYYCERHRPGVPEKFMVHLSKP